MTISVSIVSHSHGAMVAALLDDLHQCRSIGEVLLTLNVPEPEIAALEQGRFRFAVRIVRNRRPKGFGANHNAAFRAASGETFCVLNPDIRLESDPFPALLGCLDREDVGVAAPLVVNSRGVLQDSARPFPTPTAILAKALGAGSARYPPDQPTRLPDWVAGMCMLFRSEVFRKIGGFDESYFLYYEDIDLCARLRVSGYRAVLCPDAVVVHDAQRASHRSVRYLAWHVRSILRFFLSPVYRRIQQP